MVQWQSFDVKGIVQPLTQINSVINVIDGVIDQIDTYNNILSSVIDVLNAIKFPTTLDPQSAIIDSLVDQVVKMAEKYADVGGYVLPILSQDNRGGVGISNFTGLEGGSLRFKETVINSFYDEYDTNKPNFDDRSACSGIVFAIDTGDINAFVSAYDAFRQMFNIDTILPLANPVGLNYKSFSDRVLLQWTKSLGIEPTYFVIEARSLNEATFIEIGRILLQSNTSVYRFEHIPKERGSIYIYRVYSEHSGVASDSVATVQAGTQLAQIETQASENSCAYVKCVEIDGILTLSCGLDSDTANNFNNTTCLAGTTICENITNANCKYNINGSCTNTNVTGNAIDDESNNISKTIVKDQDGNIILIPNSCFYNNTRCQRGITSQVCDGYDKELKKLSVPPDWTAFTLRSYFPNMADALDSIVNYMNSFKSTTQKQGDAQILFSNTLSSTADALKTKLNEIKGFLEALERIFNVSLPNVYILTIPPNRGGINYFIQEFKNASGGPNSSQSGYTMGLVMVQGGLDLDEVNRGFQSLQFLF